MGLIVSLVSSGVGALNKTTWSMIVMVLLLPHSVQYVWNLFLLTLMLFGFCTGLIAHRSIFAFSEHLTFGECDGCLLFIDVHYAWMP